ncbi:MAG TPA: HAMP domain-containing sensor histidine kinase [Candidatus Eisenbacteria bacterium]|nr:HAMP domain-containing sensor histidine kinase [Candidatus Eisenbacteria bacterium]
MTISIAFSVFIYTGSNHEFDRILRIQRFRIEHPVNIDSRNVFWQKLPGPLESADVDDAKSRVLVSLIGINSIIFLVSSLLGYFLAGLTLKPIKKMVDEQNQFVTDASHELRTPLTSLRTEIEVALRSKTLSITEAKKLLESNLEDVVALQTLSDRLLELSSDQEIVSLDSVSLNDAMSSALKTVATMAKAKHITIKNTTQDVYIKGIFSSVVEVLVIVLDNAIKYSPSKSAIKIYAEKDNGMVSVIVQDKGIGISQQDLPHLFDRFYRVNKSRSKSDVPGYGLGLSIAQRIMKMHNGTIAISSNQAKSLPAGRQGTTVLVTFPTAEK